MTRLAVIQLFRLGDLLQTTPLLNGLRAAHPEARIEVIVNQGLERVVEGLASVDEVIPFPHHRLAGLANDPDGGLAAVNGLKELSLWLERFDQAYDRIIAVSYNELTGAVARLLPGPVLGTDLTDDGYLVFRGDWPAYVHTFINLPAPNPFHLADIHCLAAGVASDSPGPRMMVTDRDREIVGGLLAEANASADRLAVFHAGASRADKRWPRDGFAAVGRALTEQGFRVVLTGDESETGPAAALAESIGAGAIDLAGQTDLGGLAALLERAEVVIGNDSGPIQMAAFLGRPTLTLFLGRHPLRASGPYGRGNIALSPNLECYPCADEADCPHDLACRRAISPGDVWAGLAAVAGQAFHPPPGSRALAHRSFFDPDGRLDWRPMIPDARSAEHAAWRRAWLEVLRPGVELQPPATAPPREFGSRELGRLAHRADQAGQVVDRLTAALTSGQGKQAQDLARRLSHLEGELRRAGKRHPGLAPISRYFAFRLAGLDQADHRDLLVAHGRLYGQITALAGALDTALSEAGD